MSADDAAVTHTRRRKFDLLPAPSRMACPRVRVCNVEVRQRSAQITRCTLATALLRSAGLTVIAGGRGRQGALRFCQRRRIGRNVDPFRAQRSEFSDRRPSGSESKPGNPKLGVSNRRYRVTLGRQFFRKKTVRSMRRFAELHALRSAIKFRIALERFLSLRLEYICSG